jgi:hypothetical protein
MHRCGRRQCLSCCRPFRSQDRPGLGPADNGRCAFCWGAGIRFLAYAPHGHGRDPRDRIHSGASSGSKTAAGIPTTIPPGSLPPQLRLAARWRGGSSRRSYCDSQFIVQKLRRKVGSNRPDERVKLGMNLELTEHRGIAQRFKDGALESGARSISPLVPSRKRSYTMWPVA